MTSLGSPVLIQASQPTYKFCTAKFIIKHHKVTVVAMRYKIKKLIETEEDNLI